MSARRSAYADQARAATHEAEQIAARWATRTGAKVRSGFNNPTAVRLVTEINARAVYGLQTCGHLAGGPGVGWWVAWEPDLMRCKHCARDVLRATQGTTEDRRCDGCSKVFDRIRPTLLQGGSVVIVLGLCGDCEAGR